MQDGEIAFLVMIVSAGVIFMITLAWASGRKKEDKA
jgi:hypothetical protein